MRGQKFIAEGSQLTIVFQTAMVIVLATPIMAASGTVAGLIMRCVTEVERVYDVQESQTQCRKR